MAGCLPGKRDNEPLDAKSGDTSVADTGKSDAGKSDTAKNDTGTSDGDASDAPSTDINDSSDVADSEADTADTVVDQQVGPDIPVGMGGCATDTQCDLLGSQPCRVATCNVKTGLCEWSEAPEQWPCDLGKCGGPGQCSLGYCLPAKEENCDDGNACTYDVCDPGLGCIHQDRAGWACPDMDPCTVGEVCVAGACVTKPMCAAKGDPCADDVCTVSGGIGYCGQVAKKSDSPIPCKGTSLCMTDGVCQGKNCSAADKADDGNPCTQDACDQFTGEVDHFPILNQPCGSDPCTPGVCKSSDGVSLPTCVTVTLCKATDPCTPVTCSKGACIPGTKMNSGEPCDDNNVCTVNTGCLKGTCKGTAIVCEDGNPCTGPGGCLPSSGCTAGLPAPDGATCDDGNGCTSGDGCKGGLCVGGTPIKCNDGKACSVDSCDPIKGCLFDSSGCP